jgi:AcrR family transcriptional regulator
MAYRRSRQMAQRLSRNRVRIIEATRKLLAQGGYRNAPVTAIAKEAGISTGSVYRYFPSKSALFVRVLGDAVRQELAVLRSASIADGRTCEQRLLATIETFVRRALAGPRLAYAFIAEPADPFIDRARIRYRRSFGKLVRTLLNEGVEAGEFADLSVDVAAACIVGAFTEALVGPLAPSARRIEDKEHLVAEICRFCLAAVRVSSTGSPESESMVRVAVRRPAR